MAGKPLPTPAPSPETEESGLTSPFKQPLIDTAHQSEELNTSILDTIMGDTVVKTGGPLDVTRAKKYKLTNAFGGKKSKLAPWSYFGSSMLNIPEPYHWEKEAYPNEIKYKGENMQQWWRPEQHRMDRARNMKVPVPSPSQRPRRPATRG